MKFAKRLLGILLLISASAATSQESLCTPCVDAPETIPRVKAVERNVVAPSASHVASRIRELGGELRDIAHDCGSAQTKRYGQMSFSVKACKWGGRYPALLVEPVSSNDAGSLVVLAANGSTVEVLFEDNASARLVRIFSGLLKEDFDEMFLEITRRGG